MRGLTRTRGTAAVLAAAVGLLLAGCGTGAEGVRTEGPALPASPTQPSPTTTPTRPNKVEALGILKQDPTISDEVRRDIQPCDSGTDPDTYPVDISYGNLTGGAAPDVVINVLTCGDAIGIGSYVYRPKDAEGDAYENVFMNEQPPVYAEISKGDLEVTRQVYAPGDPVSYPSGEEVTTYRWDGGRFAVHDKTRNDYGRVNGGEPSPEPER
ncbi:hypothetical protein [Streptomyces sp. KR80]|uniref:hypothetical protein n=1 Tax=Streptomyces sp. KR80 TaxID=3457426 RepID=UPI003FD42BD6